MAGEINVDRVGRRITAKQLLGWEAYMRLEPFGELRDDYRAASIVQMIFNMGVAKAKDRKPIGHFLLKWGEQEPERRQTWQEQQKIMTLLARAYSTPVKVD